MNNTEACEHNNADEPVFSAQELVDIREGLERYLAYKRGCCFCPICRRDEQ